MWDTISFIVGILVGMIIMTIIFWATYHSRVFIFTTCPKNTPPCLYDQYWSDPGNALAQNSNLHDTDILSIDSNNQMLYKRVPRTSACVPDASTQTIHILNPQECQFTTQAGTITPNPESFVAINDFFESPLYAGKLADGTIVNVLTDGNCHAIKSETKTTPAQDIVQRGGIPVLAWKANSKLTETPPFTQASILRF